MRSDIRLKPDATYSDELALDFSCINNRAVDLSHVAVFVPLIPALSNIVSNVPAVMLLRTLVVDFPDWKAGWLTLATASTLAGNLTITGAVRG